MVPVACWEQPGSITDPTCGFNYSAWRGDAAEWKERGGQGWPLLFGVEEEEITNDGMERSAPEPVALLPVSSVSLSMNRCVK